MREYDDPEVPISLDVDDVRDFIKYNLSIDIVYDSFCREIKVKLMLGNENISEDTVYFPLPD